LRCTIDTKADYNRIQRLFKGCRNPEKVSWLDLQKLAKLPGEPLFRVPFSVKKGVVHSSMTLGTVQLGLAYGVANKKGMPLEKQAAKIIHEAIKHGVVTIDTAMAYGEAEKRIGKALEGGLASQVRVITKLAPNCTTAADVEASIHASCRNLVQKILHTVLLHRWGMHKYSKAWEPLVDFMKAGVVQNIGVSVQNPEELMEALQEKVVSHIQLPFNILDWRWREPNVQKAIQTRPDVIIHVRSVLLQGLLISPARIWPVIHGFNNRATIKMLDKFAKSFKRKNITDLCIAYVRAQSWITSLVIGLETIAQLKENMELFLKPKLTPEQCEIIHKGFDQNIPIEFLDPSQWANREK